MAAVAVVGRPRPGTVTDRHLELSGLGEPYAREAMVIELRAGFCDPAGELLDVLDRPGWTRLTRLRRAEVVDELVRVCEERGHREAEAWQVIAGRDPRHVIGYWHDAGQPAASGS